MNNFKIGDRVKITTAAMCGHIRGDIRIIKHIHNTDSILVEVKGRVSTSKFKPYVAYNPSHLKKIINNWRSEIE